MITNTNKKVLHKKEWQFMGLVPTATVAGAFIVKDPVGIRKTALYVASATAQYLGHVDEDVMFEQLTSFDPSQS